MMTLKMTENKAWNLENSLGLTQIDLENLKNGLKNLLDTLFNQEIFLSDFGLYPDNFPINWKPLGKAGGK